MKEKITEKYRLAALILTMLLGFLNPTAQVFGAPSQPSATHSLPQAKNVQIVEVVNAAPATQITLSAEEKPGITAAFGCNAPQSGVYGLIQGQTGINLNQPASCFRLSVAQQSVLPKLSIAGLQKSSYKIVVRTLPSAFLAAFHLAPIKPLQEVPVQVSYAAALLAVLFVFTYQSFSEKIGILKAVNPEIKNTGLFVLRC